MKRRGTGMGFGLVFGLIRGIILKNIPLARAAAGPGSRLIARRRRRRRVVVAGAARLHEPDGAKRDGRQKRST